MIYRGNMIVSAKLAKQLKNLERKPECVAFGQFLDSLGEQLNKRKLRRLK